MECGNCGAENSDDAVYCKKCGKSFYELSFKDAVSRVVFKPDWFSVGGGVVAAFIVLVIAYGFLGAFDTFVYGLLPSLLVGGCVTSLLAYNKNIRAGYDYNPSLNGALAGFIIGSVVILIIILPHFPEGSILLINIPSYAIWSFVGGIIGTVTNCIRESSPKWKIISVVTVILLVSATGYLIFFTDFVSHSDHENRYFDGLKNQMYHMGLADAIDQETNLMLNNTVIIDEKNETLLNEVQMRYQRMENLTKNAQEDSQRIQQYVSSDMEREYATVLGKYSQLKHKYYNEMEITTNLTLQGDRKGAREHYQKSKTLISQIKEQKEILTTIENKNPEFKKQITELSYKVQNFVNSTKSNWMKPDFWT